MASEDDFEVLLTKEQYEGLKQKKQDLVQSTKELSEVRKEIQKLQSLINDKDKVVKNKNYQLLVKDEEIKYLLAILENIKRSVNSEVLKIENIGLSQSVYPILEDPSLKKEKSVDAQALKIVAQKYVNALSIGEETSKKIQSQEYLIGQLTKQNFEKEQRVKNSQKKILQEISEKCKLKLESIKSVIAIIQQNKELQKLAGNKEASDVEVRALKLTIGSFEKTQSELRQQLDILNQELSTEKLKQKKIVQEADELKEENENLCQQIAELDKQVKHLTADNELLKKDLIEVNKKPAKNDKQSKGDKGYRIKLLIDEHIGDIEKGLHDVGGLSKNEMRDIVQTELKDIVQYISKSIAQHK